MKTIPRWQLPFARFSVILLMAYGAVSCEEKGNQTAGLPSGADLSSLGVSKEDSSIGLAIKGLRERTVYIWRDRESCTGVIAQIPEVTSVRNVVLTTAGCIAGNPYGRSRTVVTPKFKISPLSKLEHPRIGEFLSEFLYDKGAANYGEFRSETVDTSVVEGVRGDLFFNEDRMLAVYHDDWSEGAHLPVGGVVHRDYFSLMRPVQTPQGDGYQVLLRQYDLAVLASKPDLPTKSGELLGFQIRGKPVDKPGDRYFAVIMTRDNKAKELNFEAKSVEVVGFSPKFGLIQTCEETPKTSANYITDRSAGLVLVREGEAYLIGLGSFGSPSQHVVNEKRCALTTFAHLNHHAGWMKLAYEQLHQQFRTSGP